MSEATRIRAQASGGKTVVRMLMQHEMESGHRRDSAGRAVPAWYIREVNVLRNGESVLRMHCGPAVSRNPFLQFTLRGGQAGDRIRVNWEDSRGATRSDEAAVA
jgi:sulfur-oxidizing protein SoxZ